MAKCKALTGSAVRERVKHNSGSNIDRCHVRVSHLLMSFLCFLEQDAIEIFTLSTLTAGRRFSHSLPRRQLWIRAVTCTLNTADAAWTLTADCGVLPPDLRQPTSGKLPCCKCSKHELCRKSWPVLGQIVNNPI